LDPSVEPGSNPDVRPEEKPGNLLALALLALIAGGAAGLICAGFRLALEEADRLRDRVIALAHDSRLAGFLLVTGGWRLRLRRGWSDGFRLTFPGAASLMSRRRWTSSCRRRHLI
jgi:hypothetical protein